MTRLMRRRRVLIGTVFFGLATVLCFAIAAYWSGVTVLYESAVQEGSSPATAVIALFNTKFSDNYAEASFQTIQKGQTRDQLISLLGAPESKLEITKWGGHEIWFYTSAMFFERQALYYRYIVFGADGKVISSGASCGRDVPVTFVVVDSFPLWDPPFEIQYGPFRISPFFVG
jgi:outer membrane protein assembly factor BamE (lipoprotein component of BamABCDE complex)